MPFVHDYPEEADPVYVYKRYPEWSEPWSKVQNAVMRGPSSLSPAERELIAAFVSGLNACQYCHGGHVFMAEALGVEPDLIADLLDDVDKADVDEKLKPILRYAHKLTLTPGRMIQADADAIFDAGWDERAFQDVIMVCAMFNFMNRLVDGFGIQRVAFTGDREASMAAIRELDYLGIVRQGLDALG